MGVPEGPMKTPEYDALSHSRSALNTLRAFGELTDMAVRLAPIDPAVKSRMVGCETSPLCQLILQTTDGEAACHQFLAALQGDALEQSAFSVRRCFAGLTEMAVPIIVHGTPVAVLVCGQFFQKDSIERGFDCWLRRLRKRGVRIDGAKARQAFSGTEVVFPARLRAVRQLLLTLAQHLGELAGHCLLARCPGDPPCVKCAKAFAQANLLGGVKTRDAAHEAQVTEEYFCRAFKATTGMTFSEYVARVRIEQAKQLLADPKLRVTDVAFGAGFQSIPHFNHVFKRHNGTSPRQYRARLAGKPAKA